MAVSEIREPLVSGASWTAAAKRVSGLAAAIYRDWNNRRQFRRLRDMSDWELADIGLTRDDVRMVWHHRLDIEPTAHLNQVVSRRETLCETPEDAARRVC
ncbi:DUF1127 domain-containing protein [Mesorhizobium sp. Z1-4]|uniref:DUF1127 domain-containing protein n=1 Tax=Mesorhizobium sp. Z1-4 TaxID=2448478 RepID=UPI000FD6E3C5|nr:DUF1127 domain-containing protein [Mesorhizobium sp. Z1-4]